MTFSVSYCQKELFLRCSRHSGSASDGNTWQKVIFIWRKQPSKLIKQQFMEAVIRLYGNSIRLTAFRGLNSAKKLYVVCWWCSSTYLYYGISQEVTFYSAEGEIFKNGTSGEAEPGPLLTAKMELFNLAPS